MESGVVSQKRSYEDSNPLSLRTKKQRLFSTKCLKCTNLSPGDCSFNLCGLHCKEDKRPCGNKKHLKPQLVPHYTLVREWENIGKEIQKLPENVGKEVPLPLLMSLTISVVPNGHNHSVITSCNAFLNKFGIIVHFDAPEELYTHGLDQSCEIAKDRSCLKILGYLYSNCDEKDRILIIRKHLEIQRQWLCQNCNYSPSSSYIQDSLVQTEEESIMLPLQSPLPNIDSVIVEDGEETTYKSGRVDFRNLMNACFLCDCKGKTLMNHPNVPCLLICGVRCEFNRLPLSVSNSKSINNVF